MTTRTSTPARRPTKTSAVPQPRGTRVPRSDLWIWLVRGPFLAALILYYAHWLIVPWAEANRPPAIAPGAADTHGGLITGLLLPRHDAGDATTTEDDQATAGEHSDAIAPLI